MSINQLIATQYSRNKGPSPLQQLAGATQLKRQNQSLIANEDHLNEAKRNRALKFAANMATEINNTEDPAQKAELYAASRQLAEMNGHDVHLLPIEYGDQAQGMLDAAYMQVYKPMEFETMLKDQFGMTSGQKEFNSLVSLIEPALDETGKFDPSKANAEQMAAAQKLYLVPKPQGSAAITTATTPGLTDAVAGSEAQITGQKEGAKLAAQIDKKPVLEAEITEAREQVKARVAKINEQKGQVGRYEEAQNIYQELVPDGSTEVLEKIYGRGESLYPKLLRSQEGINAMARRDQIVSMLQLGARGELKGQGPITENEQAILSKAVTILSDPDISPELAKQYLDQAMNILARNAGKGGQAGDQLGGSYKSNSGISFTVE